MKKFLQQMRKKAMRKPQRIVFPEHMDSRIRKAVEILARKKIAKPVLLVKNKKYRIKGVETVSVLDNELLAFYANEMYKKRKRKGWSLGKCKKLVQQENYFGTMIVATAHADGLVSGASHTTADTLRPALQLIGTKQRFHKVSGLFFMVLKNKRYLFADCAVTISPSSQELAGIAIDSARTAKIFGIDPKVALLSFSTLGSAQHEEVAKVQKALRLAKKKNPKLSIDGELQVDAALVPGVAKLKAPFSKIAGKANVLIFPDLNSGNIAYKLVERLAGAQAIGPIIQGLAKPVNDLSRGCSVEDIINLTAITSVMAQKK